MSHPARDGLATPRGTDASAPGAAPARLRAHGKFFFDGAEKVMLKGVTYGPFRPDAAGELYGARETAAHDLARMAENGFNAVRTYTVPPRWLLDSAAAQGLRLMVGVPWEQHVAFLDSRTTRRRILRNVGEAARGLAFHPGVLGLAVGNEIPAPIVRLYGATRVERFLAELADAAKQADPDGLVTYVNYPTTEYLELPFLDFMAFNVYLEREADYRAYLRRLQNLAGERPLVLGELGLDSRRNGLDKQAETLDWQLRATFAAGAAGAFVYGWTDEWHRGGHEIEDWDFGLTTREREPKPALEAVRHAFAETPFRRGLEWPRISVVVCSYNGARTIRDTLDHLAKIDYPDYEMIVVNDGSRDETPRIAESYPGVRVISTENRGLSAARNTGLEAATGEIVAYTDDDAYPDRDWLRFVAAGFRESRHVGIGGPNIAPYDDGFIGGCVAASPGGPLHVLVDDETAEHIPGCNMSFRAAALRAIGGFDVRYRTAGDDVDVCWRLQDAGGTIGFHPGAVVWHHRRNSARAFWRQQIGYGRAEALLEDKWPERYNAVGHLFWRGRIYGPGLTRPLLMAERVYHGPWGSAPFQGLYRSGPTALTALPLMPEWYLLIAALAVAGLLGLSWPPLLWAALAVPVCLAISAVQSVASARIALDMRKRHGSRDLRALALTAAFHMMQPIARLRGRIRFGLTPWRRRASGEFTAPVPATVAIWAEHWRAPEARLAALQARLHADKGCVAAGGPFDRWDLELRSGLLGGARVLMAPEEHGAGRQNLVFRIRPFATDAVKIAVCGLVLLAALAAGDGAWVAAAGLALAAVGVGVLTARAAGVAIGTMRAALDRLGDEIVRETP